MTTVRQQIMELLEQKDWDARTLSQRLSIREKEVYAHLPHILRSVEAAGKELIVIGPECLGCGFTFEARKKRKNSKTRPVPEMQSRAHYGSEVYYPALMAD